MELQHRHLLNHTHHQAVLQAVGAWSPGIRREFCWPGILGPIARAATTSRTAAQRTLVQDNELPSRVLRNWRFRRDGRILLNTVLKNRLPSFSSLPRGEITVRGAG